MGSPSPVIGVFATALEMWRTGCATCVIIWLTLHGTTISKPTTAELSLYKSAMPTMDYRYHRWNLYRAVSNNAYRSREC